MVTYIVTTRDPLTKKLLVLKRDDGDVAEFETEEEALEGAKSSRLCLSWGAEVVPLAGPEVVAVPEAAAPLRCLVEGCANTSDLGAFEGTVCAPCANFLRGRGDRANSSQAYRNHVRFARQVWDDVFASRFKLRDLQG